MTADPQKTDIRKATDDEVAFVVRTMREVRGWTQETLAALSGIQTRTVQRVEGGQRSSSDTRRALSRAFEFEDLDFFDRPMHVADAEAVAAERVEFERNHLVLDAESVDGRGLVAFIMDMSDFGAVGNGGMAGLTPKVQDAFAAILDYVRDCMDVRDVASRSEMLSYGDELQGYVDELHAEGHSLVAARRKAAAKASPDGGRSFPLNVIYLLAAPTVPGIKTIAVPRDMTGPL